MAKPIFDRKNVVVTGGAGFIGSFLCEELVKSAKVICIDNFVSSSQENISQLLSNTNFAFLRHDINQPIDLETFPELERFKIPFQGIQEVYHLACPTSPKDFNKYKIETLLANSFGIQHALSIALKYQAKFLHTSTSVIYGPRPSDNHPFREEEFGLVDLLSQRACYDEGKRFAETMVATYHQVHGLDVKIARIFRTYGPRMPLGHGHMIPDFITNALEGKDLIIYGDEHFVTSLCYVTDIVDGLVRLMSAPATIGPVNLGSDIDVELVEVAKQILVLTNSKSKIIFEEPLLFMTSLGLPDLTKTKERLGWLPLVSLERGLKKSVEYTMAEKGRIGLS